MFQGHSHAGPMGSMLAATILAVLFLFVSIAAKADIAQLDSSVQGTSGLDGNGQMISLGTSLSGNCVEVDLRLHITNVSSFGYFAAIYISDSPQTMYNQNLSLVTQSDFYSATLGNNFVSIPLACTFDSTKFYYLLVYVYGSGNEFFGETSNITSFSIIPNAVTNQTNLAVVYFDLVGISSTTNFLSYFPIHNPTTGDDYSPYTVPIITVFDHSPPINKPPDADAPYPLYACDDVDTVGHVVTGEVLAFTGDAGYFQYGSWGHNKGDKFCYKILGGVYHGYQLGYGICLNAGCTFPNTTINYVGATSEGGPYYLNYEVHPGYDYAAQHLKNGQLLLVNTPVYAATAGTVYYPTQAVGMNPVTFHALALAPDAGQDYRLYYLHLLTYPGSAQRRFKPMSGCYTDANGNPIKPSTLPLPAGTHVEAGCELGRSGSAGLADDKQSHLHFEVQRRVPAGSTGPADPPTPEGPANPELAKLLCTDKTWKPYDATMMCVPVDPYGWKGPKTDCTTSPPKGDKYACLTGVTSTTLWVPSLQ